MLAVQRTFDDLGTPLYEVPFVVVDLETTGGSPQTDAITEVGAVKLQRGEVIGEFQTLVNPGVPIPPSITILTGITHSMVIEAPRIEAVLPALLEFIGDSIFVAHNAGFDAGFIRAACRSLGYEFPNSTLDTVRLARRLLAGETRNLKLATLASYFRSPTVPNHRALDDARATAHVFHGLLERAGTLGVTGLEDLLALPTASGSPTYNKLSLTDGLPRSPGVYLFRDRHGEVIYVGKAKNLRSRVRSYFYGDTRRSITTMLRELDEIDHIRCSTELEAEVTEVRLIHAHRPRHNRRSRPPKASHWVRLTDEEFPRISLVRTHRPADPLALGPFRSRKAAELVMHALWDALPIRRCTGSPGSRQGRCQYAQLGVAHCPCAGDLSTAEYASVMEALGRGVREDPALLLNPIADRMRLLAAGQRFEEASWSRDRHRALARALRDRRNWELLLASGQVLARRGLATVLIDGGYFLAGWTGDEAPLLPPPTPTTPMTTPPDALVAEEAGLLWTFLSDPATEVLESGPLPSTVFQSEFEWLTAAEHYLRAP